MPSQTRTWQKEILDNAKRDGYAGLYWYVEGTLPLSERKSKDGHFPAAWPGVWVPVVAVGLAAGSVVTKERMDPSTEPAPTR